MRENNRSTSSVRRSLKTGHRTRFRFRTSSRWVCLLPPCLRFIFWRTFSHFSLSFHFWFYVILLYTHLHLQTYLHINIIHFMKDVCRFVVITAVRAPESKSNGRLCGSWRRVSSLTADRDRHATARRTTPPGQDCTPSPVSSVHRQDSDSHLNGWPGTNLTEEAVVCDSCFSPHSHFDPWDFSFYR